MEEKSAKAQQYKTFGYIAGVLVIVFAIMMFFREDAEASRSTRYYKREITNGVDGLSDKDLWVEKSTNEIEEIRQHNKKLEEQNTRLQKQLDSVQKLVIGLGVHLKAFDDQQGEDKTDAIPSKDVPEYEKYKKENPYISQNLGADTDLVSDNIKHPSPINKLENFIEQRGVIGNDSMDYPTNSGNLRGERNSKVLKNGIQVIKFNNTDSEYDLDENFIFAGTYARAVLIGSVTVSAGIGASSDPKPVLLRISDGGNLPNNIKSFLKDAIVIGAAYGNLSSESVVIRLERIVKIDRAKGVGVDIPVKGYVAGENGDSDIDHSLWKAFTMLSL